MDQTTEQAAPRRARHPNDVAQVIGAFLTAADSQTVDLQHLQSLCALLSSAVEDEHHGADQITGAFDFIGAAVSAMAGSLHDTLYETQEEAKRHFAETHGIAWRKNDIIR